MLLNNYSHLQDAIPEDIVCLLEGSKKSFISALVNGCQPLQKGKQRKKTVISKFEVMYVSLSSFTTFL